MQLTTEQKVALWNRARTDPVFHIRHVQGVPDIEPYQERLIRAIAEHKRVAVRSCHCMGKTWTVAKVVLWFLSTHPRAKIVTTAPTSRQVELLLWSEINTGHKRSRFPLGGKILTKKWEIASDWWAIGFTTDNGADSGAEQAGSGFQGIHGEHVLVIFDEATGIGPDIWKQLEGLLTSHNVKFVGIGNPTSKASEFFKCFSDAAYKKVHLSCFDSPNLQANGIHHIEDLKRELDRLREMDEEMRLRALAVYQVPKPHLVTTEWVVSLALKLGVDHPLFLSKALGDFPNTDDSCLMPLGVVEQAQRREFDTSSRKCSIGVDVARFGTDKSVITRMVGPNVSQVKTLMKRDTNEVAGATISIVNALPMPDLLGGVVITVDGTGIGAGVVDKLKEYRDAHSTTGAGTWRNVEIREMHFGETFKVGRDGDEHTVKERSEQFANKKAEAFVLLAQALKDEITLPPLETVYLEELPTIVYKFDSKGRWVIEDKEAYKKRTRRGSPDYADSLALANYGRYYRGGGGTFTAEMAEPQGQPIANPKMEW